MKKKIGWFLILFWLSFLLKGASSKKRYLITDLSQYLSSKFRLYKTKQIGIDFPRFTPDTIENKYSEFLYNFTPGMFDIYPEKYDLLQKFFTIEDKNLDKFVKFTLNFSPPLTNIIKLSFYLLYFMYEDNFYFQYFHHFRTQYELMYKKLFHKKFLQPISCLETNLILGRILQKAGFNLIFMILPPMYYFNRKLPEAHVILLIEAPSPSFFNNIKKEYILSYNKKNYFPLDATYFLKGKDGISPFLALNLAVQRGKMVFDFVIKNKLSLHPVYLSPQKVKFSKSSSLKLKSFIEYILNSRKPLYEK